MRWVRLLVAGLLLMLAGAPAPAEQPATITVTVRGADGKPLQGVEVRILRWPNSQNPVARGTTDKDGNFTTTDSEGTPLPPDTYQIGVRLPGTDSAQRIVYVGAGGKVEAQVGPEQSGGISYDIDEALRDAAAAKEKGDTAAYQRETDYVRRNIAQEERLMDEAQAAADAFARDHGLRVTDLAGAEKDLKALEKLGENADQEVKRNLERYIEKLRSVDFWRRVADDYRKQLAELEERKFGLLPSACPEGESGGLLAGSLNALFGTDLAGVCGDQAGTGMRRDTERHDRHEGHGSNR
jgi:hypothetical protein